MTSRVDAQAVSAVFSTSIFSALGAKQEWLASPRLTVLAEVVGDDPSSMTLAQAFDVAHDCLSETYRSEYFYKNTIISKIIFGRHSARTAAALLELPSGGSIADLVIFNGTSTVYEIKTDLDSFSRLPTQLSDYQSRFEHVNVVTSIDRVGAAEKIAPKHVGIIGVRRNGALSVVRASEGGLERLRQDSIFRLLRQKEALAALGRACGFEIDVPSGDIWARCRELFDSLPIEVAHLEALYELKSRAMQGAALAAQENFPASLRALAYATELSGSARNRVALRLTKELAEVMHVE